MSRAWVTPVRARVYRAGVRLVLKSWRGQVRVAGAAGRHQAEVRQGRVQGQGEEHHTCETESRDLAADGVAGTEI